MNALDDYLSKRQIGNTEFAEMVGLSQASVSRLRRGKQAFSEDVLRAIAKVTNGAVTPNDLLGTTSRERVPTERQAAQ